MINFKISFAKKLHARRIEMGFKSQAALAREIDVDTSRVNLWEKGKNFPDAFYREKLCQVLKIDQSFFETIEVQESSGMKKADLIAAIITALPSLNDNELGDVLSLIKQAPSTRSRFGSDVS